MGCYDLPDPTLSMWLSLFIPIPICIPIPIPIPIPIMEPESLRLAQDHKALECGCGESV